MPQVCVPARTILISEEIFTILQQLKIAATGNFDETELVTLLTSAPQNRSGLGSYIAGLFEKLFSIHLKGQQVSWPEVHYALDTESQVIWEAYRGELDELLRSYRISNQDIGSGSIADERLFIVEILLRMTIVALSLSTTQANKSKKILHTISMLISGLSQPRAFVTDLRSRKHSAHIPIFKAIVDSNQVLHAHRNAISSAVDVITKVKHLLVCRLIAELSPEKTSAELVDRVAVATLQQCQKEFLYSHGNDIGSAEIEQKALIYLTKSNLCSRQEALMQTQVIRLTNSPVIRKLYQLLNDNILIVQMLGKIEKLIDFGSWFAFVSGLVDVRKLASCLKDYLMVTQNCLNNGEHRLARTHAGDEFLRYKFQFETGGLDSSFQEIHAIHGEYFQERLKAIGMNIVLDFTQLQNVLEWQLTHPQLLHGVVDLDTLLNRVEHGRLELATPLEIKHNENSDEVTTAFIESMFYSDRKDQRNKMRNILERAEVHFPGNNILGKYNELQKQWKGIQSCLQHVAEQRAKMPSAADDAKLKNTLDKYRRICNELSVNIRTFCQSDEVVTSFTLWRKKKLVKQSLSHSKQSPQLPVIVQRIPNEDLQPNVLVPPAAAASKNEVPVIAQVGQCSRGKFLALTGLSLTAAIAGAKYLPYLFGQEVAAEPDPVLAINTEEGQAAAVAIVRHSSELFKNQLVKAGSVLAAGVVGKFFWDSRKGTNKVLSNSKSVGDLPRSVSMADIHEESDQSIEVTNITRARSLSI